ncbi:MAG: class I SAM-dependent RNA methyltransferase [Smithella sp.]
MNIWKNKSTILITCPKGVAPYLQAEIAALKFPVLAQFDTAIRTAGSLEDTLFLNLHLRTASRVLYLLDTFTADTPGALYGNLSNFSWENLISAAGKDAYLCVTSTVDNPQITDSRFVNLKAKDAIVDRIRDKCGVRPDSGPEKDKAVVHIYWKNNKAAVYLDTSGERLAMRGYRKIPLAAPMQETLAAAIIMATGWNGKGAFVNPMCGSGTLAVEAAMIATNRAPGLLRGNFGFMHIREFPETLWQEMRKNARNAAQKTLPVKIIATDIDPEAVHAARRNSQTAGVDHLIEFNTCSYEKTFLPEGGGVIVVNPPYGERMDTGINKNQSRSRIELANGRKIIVRKASGGPDKRGGAGIRKRLEILYQGLGDFFKKTSGGYHGYIFTGNLEMIKKVGLRTKQRIILYNGDIECRLLEYELYQGSRKNLERNQDLP